MFELERFDRETGMPVEPPFYLLTDGSKINFSVFRSPQDYQYAVLSADTFERVKSKIIIRQDIERKRLIAQLDPFPNAIIWHGEYADILWNLGEVYDYQDWYRNSKWIGFLNGMEVKRILPRTYEQFQGKRDELVKAQWEYEKWVNSLKPVSTEPVPF